MAVILNTSCKKFERHQINVLSFYLLLHQLPRHAIFFYFLMSVINHYHINRLYRFRDSFEWFCLQISSDANYFFLFGPRHCDQGLIVIIVYYFQIWNKKNTTLLLVELLTMSIETPYTSDFESHWASHSFGLVPHQSKELCKLPILYAVLKFFMRN